MKTPRIVFAFLLVLIGAVAAQSAFAGPYHGGYRGGYRGGHWHGSVGLYFGAPFFGFPSYYQPFYQPYYQPYSQPYYPAYYPPVQQAPVYVEQNPQPAPPVQQTAPAGYWYYCADTRAYYPYVNECPAGWQRVAPRPN